MFLHGGGVCSTSTPMSTHPGQLGELQLTWVLSNIWEEHYSWFSSHHS